MEFKARILIIAPGGGFADELITCLERRGYWVLQGEDGRLFSRMAIDLAFIAWQAKGPKMLSRIRRDDMVMPVLVYAEPFHLQEQLLAYQGGADECISSNISLPLLLAKIKAHLRRLPEKRKRGVFKLGNIQYNADLRCLIDQEGKYLSLTTFQARLLEVFLECPGKLFTREEIMMRIWKHTNIFKSRSMDVIMRKLRNHLRCDPGVQITTHWRKGFILECAVQQVSETRSFLETKKAEVQMVYTKNE